MRLTVISRLDCKRIVPYNPNDHSILDIDGNAEVAFDEIRRGKLSLRFRFHADFRKREDKQVWGILDIEGSTSISDPALGPHLIDETRRLRLPENVRLLVDGAWTDDVLTPVSLLTRAMRLPGLVHSPVEIGEYLQLPESPQAKKSGGE